MQTFEFIACCFLGLALILFYDHMKDNWNYKNRNRKPQGPKYSPLNKNK